MKRLFALIIIAVIIISAGAYIVFVNNYTGECGDNIKWVFNPFNKTLTISGEDKMYDYTDDTESPWA